MEGQIFRIGMDAEWWNIYSLKFMKNKRIINFLCNQ
jgi:hypothetical protein